VNGRENFHSRAGDCQIRKTRHGFSASCRGKGTARDRTQIRYLLEDGQTGIDVIGDAPTQSLLDPDHPLAREAVGTQGVSLCRKQDFLDLLKDLPLVQVSISSSVPAFFALPGLVGWTLSASRHLPIGQARQQDASQKKPRVRCGHAIYISR
jgi:methylmalonyl-CoA mutase N-terminal domain/subunit